jgi:hypothetical protein
MVQTKVYQMKKFDVELQIQVNTRRPLHILLGENCCLVHGVYIL